MRWRHSDEEGLPEGRRLPALASWSVLGPDSVESRSRSPPPASDCWSPGSARAGGRTVQVGVLVDALRLRFAFRSG